MLHRLKVSRDETTNEVPVCVGLAQRRATIGVASTPVRRIVKTSLPGRRIAIEENVEIR